eukprot:6419433-Pyramimonas_sp.AAC.1
MVLSKCWDSDTMKQSSSAHTLSKVAHLHCAKFGSDASRIARANPFRPLLAKSFANAARIFTSRKK